MKRKDKTDHPAHYNKRAAGGRELGLSKCVAKAESPPDPITQASWHSWEKNDWSNKYELNEPQSWSSNLGHHWAKESGPSGHCAGEKFHLVMWAEFSLVTSCGRAEVKGSMGWLDCPVLYSRMGRDIGSLDRANSLGPFWGGGKRSQVAEIGNLSKLNIWRYEWLIGNMKEMDLH